MEYRNILELKKLENNPRTISAKEFEILKKSIADNPDSYLLSFLQSFSSSCLFT